MILADILASSSMVCDPTSDNVKTNLELNQIITEFVQFNLEFVFGV